MFSLLVLALGPLSAALLFPSPRDIGTGHQPPSPFTITPAFNLNVHLTVPPLIHPPNTDGVVGIHASLGGTVSDPLLNGTITGGLSHASIFADYYIHDAHNYGHTDDGVEFVFRHSGSGNKDGKLDRVVSEDIFTLDHVLMCSKKPWAFLQCIS